MSFDRVASFYRTLETIAFGRALQRARVRWLGEVTDRARVLVVGEGDGRFLTELLRRHPHVQIDCLDQSARMLELAKQRLDAVLADAHVRLIHDDILRWMPNSSYNLIVTHFVLDCFDETQLEPLVRKLADAAEPNATWLLADFRIPNSGAFRVLGAKVWIRVMYLFFRIAAGLRTSQLVDPSPYLLAARFSLTNGELTRCGMIKSQVWRKSVGR